MLYFIGVAFLQSLKWAILFIYTRDSSSFTFKLKLHYVCFNLRPGGGGTAIYGLGTYLPLRQVGFFKAVRSEEWIKLRGYWLIWGIIYGTLINGM